jgi:hypothetical protein
MGSPNTHGLGIQRKSSVGDSACDALYCLAPRYRNKALGSDHEDEVVLHAVRDDLDDPLAVVLKNKRHEAKLRDWAQMDVTDKWVTRVTWGDRMAAQHPASTTLTYTVCCETEAF